MFSCINTRSRINRGLSVFIQHVSAKCQLFNRVVFRIIESLKSKNLRITSEFILFCFICFFFSFFFFSRYFRFIKFFEFYVCLNSPKGNVCTSSCVLVRPRYYLSYRRLLCEQSFNGSQKSYNGEFPPQRVRLCITSVTIQVVSACIINCTIVVSMLSIDCY